MASQNRTVAPAPFARLAGCCALLALAAPVSAQVVQRPQRSVTVPGSIAPSTAEVEQTAADRPDERLLWHLVAAGDYAVLEQRVARLRTAYPSWYPPVEMVALMAENADERAFAAAKAKQDWGTVRQLARSRPALASCARPDDAAVVAAAPGATPALGRALDACPDDGSGLLLLQAALDRFGPEQVGPLVGRFDGRILPQAGRNRLEHLRAELAFRRLGRALATRSPEARALGQALRPAIEARRDAGTASALGWVSLQARQPREALEWFEAARRFDPAQSGTGLVRAMAASGDLLGAQRLLAQLPRDADLDRLAAEIDTARINAAYQGGNDLQAAELAARQADPPLVLGWSLLRLGRADAAAQAFERRYRRHNEAAAAEGLLLATMQANRPDQATELASRLGGKLAVAAEISAGRQGADIGYQLALARLRQALDRHDRPGAAALADALTGPVQARKDAAAAATLGWVSMEGERWSEARTWFLLGADAPDADTRQAASYGLGLATFKLGDDATVLRMAAANPGAERWRRLRLDTRMREANRLSAADPGSAEAAVLAREVQQEEPSRRDAALLLAWDAYHHGRKAEASAAFSRLYRTQPDEPAAIGVATATDDVPASRALAESVGGPLAPALQRRSAQDAFARKDFLLAARIDPGLDRGLQGLDAPTFGLSGTYRSKSGGPGTSQLDAEAVDVTGAVTNQADRFTLRVHLIHLDAGRPAGMSNAPGAMTTHLALGAEPSILWERHSGASLSPFAEIGTTPLGGAVGPTAQVRAGLGWQGLAADRTVNLRLTIYRQSVTESLLSYTGAFDSTTGRRFGRVTETGAQGEGFLQVQPRWGIYGQIGGGVRDGVDVRSNGHLQASTTLSYAPVVPGLDSFSVGPSYRFSAFSHDLGGFTPGQGGYYSPAASHAVGAALRLLTRESQDFTLRVSAFTGWQFAHTAGSAHRAAGRQDGFNASGEVAAAYRLSERWVLGGMLRGQVSPQFNDLYAGLSLTRSFGARASLLSADLPQFDQR